MTDRIELFDPEDPYHIMHNHFHRAVAVALTEAMKTTVYREMSILDQVKAMMEGTLSGISTAVVISTEGNCSDEAIIQGIVDLLPAAVANGREFVKAMKEQRRG